MAYCLVKLPIVLLFSKLINSFVFDPTRFTRSDVAITRDERSLGILPENYVDISSWVHDRTTNIGNISDFELKAVLESIKEMSHPESPKYPRIKVYNYNFDSDTREILLYIDPDEGKQWIVNIEDLDLRQNLIIFRLGDLGFGFRKENTFIVLRKSMTKADPFHYMHLAYIIPHRPGRTLKTVEWDNIKPVDLLPIPMLFNEPVDDHAEHCKPRSCGIKEWIFGTCPIVKLSCNDVKSLALNKHDKEHIYAMIREKQPFMHELARSLGINQNYWDHISKFVLDDADDDDNTTSRKKREITNGIAGEQALVSNPKPEKSAPTDGKEQGYKDNQYEPEASHAAASGQQLASGEDESHLMLDHNHFLSVDSAFGTGKAPAETADQFMFPKDAVGKSFDPSSARKRVLRTNPPPPPKKTPNTLHKRSEPDKTLSNSSNSSEPSVRNFTGNHGTSTSKALPHPTSAITSGSPPGNIAKALNSAVLDNDSPEKGVLGQLEHIIDQSDDDVQAPSSFDQLLLKNGNNSGMIHGNESYFQNILQKIRAKPPSKSAVSPSKCIGCEPIGTFFSEFEEDTEYVSPVMYNVIADVFRNTPTNDLFSPEAQEMLQEHPNVPFVGYGPCDYSVDILGKSPKSPELDDIIDFYAETLSVNCENKDCQSQLPRTRMRELLTSKYHMLKIDTDMSIRLNRSSHLAKALLLSTNEFRQFMVSLIFSAYTTEFVLDSALRVDADNENSLNPNQSHQMKFITRIILHVLDELVKNFPQHLIKGLRYLLQILQDKFLSLAVEHFGIMEFNFMGNERERTVYTVINKNDRLQVLALKDFLINGGIAPISRSGTDSRAAFTTFFRHNRKRIVHSLIAYGVDNQDNEEKTLDQRVDEFMQELDLFEQASKLIVESEEVGIPSSAAAVGALLQDTGSNSNGFKEVRDSRDVDEENQDWGWDIVE